MATFNTMLLRLVREQKGFSQSVLAERLAVRQAVLSKYENGVITPSDEMMEKLSKCLGYPPSFFFQVQEEVPSGLIYHRKRSSLTAAVRTKLEAEAKLRTLDVSILFERNNLKSNIISHDGDAPEEVARRLREHWELGVGTIDNFVSVLEKNGIAVLCFDFKTDKLDGFFIPLNNGIICLALNSKSPADRQRFTLAHELGHVLLHHGKFPDKAMENEADRFASEFLMPAKTIKKDLTPPLSFERLMELKSTWNVSIASLIRRARDLGTITEGEYRRMCIFLSSNGFRKKEPDCGVTLKAPQLVNDLMQKYVTEDQNFLNVLQITRECFEERYPGMKINPFAYETETSENHEGGDL